MCHVVLLTIFSKHIHTYNPIFSSKDTLSDKKGSFSLVANERTEGESLADFCPAHPTPANHPGSHQQLKRTVVHFSFQCLTLINYTFFIAFRKKKKRKKI